MIGLLAAAVVVTSSGSSALAMQRDAALALDVVVEETFAELARHLKDDVPISEAETAAFAKGAIARAKLVTDEAPVVAFGAHAADPAWNASDSLLQRGDVVLLEVAAKKDEPGALYADVTWTAFAGRANAIPVDVARAWATVRDARDRTVAALAAAARARRPLTGADADRVARDVVARARKRVSYPHATGHALGESDLGDAPNLSEHETRTLTTGECVTVEPGIYAAGKWGVRSGVNVCLDPDDAPLSNRLVQREIRPLLDTR